MKCGLHSNPITRVYHIGTYVQSLHSTKNSRCLIIMAPMKSSTKKNDASQPHPLPEHPTTNQNPPSFQILQEKIKEEKLFISFSYCLIHNARTSLWETVKHVHRTDLAQKRCTRGHELFEQYSRIQKLFTSSLNVVNTTDVNRKCTKDTFKGSLFGCQENVSNTTHTIV